MEKRLDLVKYQFPITYDPLEFISNLIGLKFFADDSTIFVCLTILMGYDESDLCIKCIVGIGLVSIQNQCVYPIGHVSVDPLEVGTAKPLCR